MRTCDTSTAEALARLGVVAVIQVNCVDSAVKLAQTLVRVGGPAMEITLRTPVAVEAIAAIVQEVPEALIGAGTVLNVHDLERVAQAGAQFAISPGASDDLYDAATQIDCPWIPGVATASEVMAGLDRGHHLFKFFPAEASGGVSTLKAWSGPLSEARFIPTGGVSLENAPDYLALGNVVAVGGSWMVPSAAIEDRDWAQIEALALSCLSLSPSSST